MEITATMAGTILFVNKNAGENVKKGEEVIVLESMKMEIPIESTADGVIDSIMVNTGDFVNEGDILIRLK